MADDHFVPGDPQTCERSARHFQERVQKMSFDEMLAKIKELGINGTAAMYAIPECKKAAIELGRLTTEHQTMREAIEWVIRELRFRETDHAKMVKAILQNALTAVSGTPGKSES